MANKRIRVAPVGASRLRQTPRNIKAEHQRVSENLKGVSVFQMAWVAYERHSTGVWQLIAVAAMAAAVIATIN